MLFFKELERQAFFLCFQKRTIWRACIIVFLFLFWDKFESACSRGDLFDRTKVIILPQGRRGFLLTSFSFLLLLFWMERYSCTQVSRLKFICVVEILLVDDTRPTGPRTCISHNSVCPNADTISVGLLIIVVCHWEHPVITEPWSKVPRSAALEIARLAYYVRDILYFSDNVFIEAALAHLGERQTEVHFKSRITCEFWRYCVRSTEAAHDYLLLLLLHPGLYSFTIDCCIIDSFSFSFCVDSMCLDKSRILPWSGGTVQSRPTGSINLKPRRALG